MVEPLVLPFVMMALKSPVKSLTRSQQQPPPAFTRYVPGLMSTPTMNVLLPNAFRDEVTGYRRRPTTPRSPGW